MASALLDAEEVSRLYRRAADRTEVLVDDLVELVGMESPTGDVARIEAIADVVAARWEDMGAAVIRHPRDGVGVHLEMHWPGPRGTPAEAPPSLVVGHLDTVHAVGGLDRNPVRRSDAADGTVPGGLLHGPGTQDMKGGLVAAWHAVDLLRRRRRPLPRPVTVLVTADEEAGSLSSRELVEDLSRRSRHALVLEGAAADGSLKTARKGVGLYVVTVTGRAAHAGVHFEDGINAAVALARVLPDVAGLTDVARGTTVNVGVVRAGTVVNVVPELAVAQVDVRFTDDEEAKRVDQALRELEAFEPGVTVAGGVNRPAMVRTGAIAGLFDEARRLVAHEQSLTETAVGGASDGNFTAAVGTPTLDGLGPEGAGLHTDHEYVRVASLPQRAALVAVLLAGL